MPPAFSLQAVLNYRERIVETLQLELAQLLSEEHAIRLRLDNLRQNEQLLFQSLACVQVGVLDMFVIQQMHLQLRAVQKQIELEQSQLETLQHQVAAKRSEVVAAEQAKETLDKLKANEHDRWLIEIARREAIERDDQYIARAYHAAREV